MAQRTPAQLIDDGCGIIKQAYLGDNNIGLQSVLDDAIQQLKTYIEWSKNNIEIDLQTKAAKDYSQAIDKIISKAEPALDTVTAGIARNDITDLQITNLRAILEHMEVIGFFVERLVGAMNQLVAKKEMQTEKDGISRYAQLEIEDLCQRLHSIRMFVEYALGYQVGEPALEEEVTIICKQLQEFAGIAMDRHRARLSKSECQIEHDLHYRKILDSITSIGSRITAIAHHWATVRDLERPDLNLSDIKPTYIMDIVIV